MSALLRHGILDRRPRIPFIASFDALVASFEPDVVSYWKFDETAGATFDDFYNTQDAALTGSPERSVPTIVEDDEGGVCIAWTGAIGEYAEAANNAAHATAEGTIVAYHQHDSLVEKSTLLCRASMGIAAGALSLEVTENGTQRSFIRDSGAVAQVLLGETPVALERAYTSIVKWGALGYSMTLWDDLGIRISHVTNPLTTGLAGSSQIRFGAWHTDVAHHDGPFGRVVWLDRRISDAEEFAFAKALTIEHETGGGNGGTINGNLPLLGLYYGADAFGSKAGNTHLNNGNSDRGISYFFIGERAGKIDRIFWQPRMGTGYASGNGGVYTIQIRTANPNTRLPIPMSQGGQVISQLTGYAPNWNGSATSTVWINRAFTSTPGDIVPGDPYCLVFINTHANPGSNYISDNVSLHHAFSGSAGSGSSSPPSNYQEPAGTDPASLGSSPTTVQGWVPMLMPDGSFMFPKPPKAVNGLFQYNRLGPEHSCFRYTDGQWTGFGHAGGGQEGLLTVTLNNTSTMLRVPFRVSRATRQVDGVLIRLARINGTTGNLTVQLQLGPQSDSHNMGAGSVVQTVTVPHTAIYNAGAEICSSEFSCGANVNYTPYVWVPYPAVRTLTLGSVYQLVLSVDASLDIQITGSDRPDGQGLTPDGTTVATWAQWETQRQVPWNGWEDSRGFQLTTNGGTNWNYLLSPDRRIFPVTFRCVN